MSDKAKPTTSSQTSPTGVNAQKIWDAEAKQHQQKNR